MRRCQDIGRPLPILVGLLAALTLSTAATGTAGAPRSCSYRAGGALPDPRCTPGALNPAVTQATIGVTICTRGWTAKIRPPFTVTEPQKYASMRAYGDRFGASARHYEFDHLVPLELGGAPDNLLNLWPEPRAGADGSYAKDGVENHLRALVCDDALTLAAARHYMRTDWRKAP